MTRKADSQTGYRPIETCTRGLRFSRRARRTRGLVSIGLTLAMIAAGCSGRAIQDEVRDAEQNAETVARVAEDRPTVIVIESWRLEDVAAWHDVIIPAFEKRYPHIDVRFVPTRPTEYDAAIAGRFRQQLAGDVIACRPFDAALELFEAGYFADLTGDPALDDFSPSVLEAWSTDDGSQTFCVPVASVIHGFLYNTEVFDELGLEPPRTVDDFVRLLAKVRADGRFVPLALGLADRWEMATVGLQTIGPTYWKGEAGRRSLIDGSAKFTDPEYVQAFAAIAAWRPFFADGLEQMTLDDARRLFATGNAAIYPAGSWDMGWFDRQAPNLSYAAFGPPVLDDAGECYLTDHTDMGMALNPATEHPEEARLLLAWLAGAEFAELYANALPGFFSLRSEPVALEHPIAKDFASWRERCHRTIRNSAQFLSRGDPMLELQLWDVTAEVAQGTLDPVTATEILQAGLDGWFVPVGGE